VIYRKGVSYKNANELSKRPCANDSCQYCTRVELKKTSNLETTIVRITLFEKNLEKGTVERSEYFCYFFILLGKETGKRSSWQQIATRDSFTKVYWAYWDSFEPMA